MDSTSFTYHITGGMPLPELWAAIVFAFMGLILTTAINVRNGIMNNPNTADAFQWKHFGWSTGIRIFCSAVITLIVVFIAIRFSHELMGEVPSIAQFGLMGFSFFIGMGIDKWTQRLVKKSK